MMIDEMVDTSKDSEVKPIHPVSPRYQSQLNHEGIRLEIPYDYAMKSGGIDKNDFLSLADTMMRGKMPNADSINNMDTDPIWDLTDIQSIRCGDIRGAS